MNTSITVNSGNFGTSSFDRLKAYIDKKSAQAMGFASSVGQLGTRTIVQVAHGFTANTPVYLNGGGTWVAADTTNFAIGVVSQVTDINTFQVTLDGYYTALSHGLVIGTTYFQGTAPGTTTTTSPTKSQPLFVPVDANTIALRIYRPFDFSVLSGPTYIADETTLHLVGTTFSINTAYAGQSSITTLGTIGTGTWQGTLLNPTYGGTGVNNTGKTITLGGNLVTSGANSLTLTTTGTTTLTLPTSGTLAALASPTFTGTPAVPTAAQGTNTTQAASTAFVLANALTDDPYIVATQLLGSTIKGAAIATSLGHVNSSAALASGTMRFIAVYLKQPATLIGVKWVASTIGNYTADQTNGVALYTFSAGTLTKVAESANTGTIWSTTPATNALANLAFASSYVAAAGVYFVAILYHSSAQTTAPQLGTAPSFSNTSVVVSDMTNSAVLGGFILTQTSFPSSQAMSGVSPNTTNIWVGLY